MTGTNAGVTLADIYREVGSARTDIGAVRGELGSLTGRIALIEQRNAQADHVHADHEERLRKQEDYEERQKFLADLAARVGSIERFRWAVAGGAAAIGAATGVIAAILQR